MYYVEGSNLPGGGHTAFVDIPQLAKDLIYATCSEGHMVTSGMIDKIVSPILKLYGGGQPASYDLQKAGLDITAIPFMGSWARWIFRDFGIAVSFKF